MEYLIKGAITGKRRVEFNCPICNAILESPLEEAGQNFPCPRCGKTFTTPGIAEYRRELDDAHAAAVAKAKVVAKLEQEARAADTRRATADAEARRKAIAASEAETANASRMSSATTCGNCGGIIGKLESRRDWEGNVVCGVCYGRLSANPSQPPGFQAPPVQYAPRERDGFNPVRVIQLLLVVLGIALIIYLLAEWVRRDEIINEVNQRFGAQ